MSRYPCPLCNSSDGLAHYENGSWCFSCCKVIQKNLLNVEDKNKKLTLELPTDLEECNNEWLKKYGIEKGYWSPRYQRLCFPYYVNNKMIGCWMRAVDPNAKRKWLYAGEDRKTYVWHLKAHKKICSKLAIVEDSVSALKVSKYIDVVCLGGTNFNSPLLIPLFLQYKELIAFFDGDKAGRLAAEKFRKEFKTLRKVSVIRTNKDPKQYQDEELKEVVNG